MQKWAAAGLLELAEDISTMGFLSGGGEMGERIRTFNWASTPLGAPQAWPEGLKAAVTLCLGSRFPTVIWWGRQELIQLYNEAYIPFLGPSKHPTFLGRSGRECWKEIWPTMGPLWDKVFATGKADLYEDFLYLINRHLPQEEIYVTFSYGAIRGETGSVDGLFCSCYETTGKVVGARRLETLRRLGEEAVRADSVADACERGVTILGGNLHDIPFVRIYRLDASGKLPADAIVPDALAAVLQTRRPAEVTGLDVAGGAWPEPTTQAVVLPLFASTHEVVAGFIVLGVSPRRPLDADYRAFFDLVAGHVSTAMANAHAREEERKRAEALAELDRAKTAFFTNVSHEFRTPLTLILGPLADFLAKSQMALSPDSRAQLEMVNRNGQRLLRLVNMLLDFSRIEAGRVEAVFEPTDLALLTSELASVFRAATDRAGLALIVDCPPLAEPVYVDRDMWEKVVLNLISNAFKFTFEGEIEVSLRAIGGHVELRVRDTGVGIPAEEMPRIFERFHRVHNMRSRTHEGSGIGLALVQELLKVQGGDVRVESVVGQGTTFIVNVPLGKEHLRPERIGAARTQVSTAVGAAPFVDEALRWLPEPLILEETLAGPSQGESISTRPVPSQTNRPRIIVADDNADLRQYLARLLSENYEVQTVTNGAAALALARERRPDLILSDIMMPRLDGFGLLQELRADPALKTVPIILLSARAGEESHVEGLQQGADDYLVKPFSAGELLARVSAHLAMARVRRETEQTLRQRTEQFETLLNNAPLGVYLVDADFRIQQVNPVARPVFGDIPALIGRDFDEVMHRLWARHYADEVVRRFRHTLATGESYETQDRTEYRVDRQTTEYYEWRIDRILLPDGRHGVVCYFRDISERKRAASRLQADLAALTRMHELSRKVLGAAGLEQLLQEVMEAAVYIVGAERGTLQLFEQDSLRIVAHHGHERPFLEFFAAAENRTSVCGEATRQGQRLVVPDVERSSLFADSPSLPVLRTAGVRAVQSTPLISRSGSLLGVLTTQWSKPYSPDEHDLWRIDLLVRQAADLIEQARIEKNLRQSEERLRMAKKAAHLGIHDWDIESGKVQWDERTRELWGVGPELPITYDVFKAGIHPDDRLPTQAAVDQALNSEGKGEYYAEFRVTHALDRQVPWIAATGQVAFEGRRPVRLVGTVQDITQHKEFQAELERLVAARTRSLQETTQQLNDFCYSIAHDLKAPIRTQVSFANLLLDDFGAHLGVHGSDYVTRMREAAQRQAKLVSDLLSHMSLNRTELPLEPVELARAIEAVCSDFHSEIQTTQAVVQRSAVSGLVLANGASLHLVLSNLLSNAIKFVVTGTCPEVSLWTEGRTDESGQGFVRLWIKDNGIGIPTRAHDKIFGVFERLHPREKYPGTGMGLAIVKRAVERMGGRVGVESEPGKGSRFWLELRVSGLA